MHQGTRIHHFTKFLNFPVLHQERVCKVVFVLARIILGKQHLTSAITFYPEVIGVLWYICTLVHFQSGKYFIFLPAPKLQTRWIAFQGTIDQVCSSSEVVEYVKEVGV
jgi:hypothetical protein